jgi:hypothetical protein
MSVTHLPTPIGTTFPGADAPVDASRAIRRRALVSVGILAVAAGAVLLVNANPGDATPASCTVVDHTWPTGLADAQTWPTSGEPAGEHAFSQPGFDVAWATAGPVVTWSSGQPTVRICG